MNETQRRPRRKPGENRELLIEAGLFEFGLFGYHGASTGGIAARAGVPQPHLYASFRTKQELFLACCERAAVGASSEEHARFLYQAVAAANTPELSPQLVHQLRALEIQLGEKQMLAILKLGASSLLRLAELEATSTS